MTTLDKNEIMKSFQEAAETTGLELEEMFEMLPDMLSSESENTKRMLDMFNQGDYTKVRAIAHSVKGATANYGLGVIAAIAKEIEDNPQGGPGWTVPDKIKEIISIFQDIQKIDFGANQ